MWTLCLILLVFHASLQLQCDKSTVTTHIGGELVLICEYNANDFLVNKKYWCRGNSRRTCTILADSESKTKNICGPHVVDSGRKGLVVKITNLQFNDAGEYWVGIDGSIPADIMTPVKVVITEVPVTKPRLRPLSSLADKPTCRGQPVTVRCVCTEGTDVRYAWYMHTHHKDFLLHQSSDLYLQCGTADSEYYCIASNDISSQESDVLSVRVRWSADRRCIYVLHMHGQPFYDCDDRMRTTTAKTPLLTTYHQATVHSDTGNRTLLINQTDQDLFFSRAWTGVPFWYTLLRWGCFASLLILLCIVLRCTKARHQRAKRKSRVRVRRTLGSLTCILQ